MAVYETTEAVRVTHTPTGTRVTVTLKQGTNTVSFGVKAYLSTIEKAKAEARLGAEEVLASL